VFIEQAVKDLFAALGVDTDQIMSKYELYKKYGDEYIY
jgi:hypothetical protein